MTDEKKKTDTPLLDELEKGSWPSFVKELKKSADNPIARDLARVLERSYRDKINHWKHGGLVGVKGYGCGVVGRYNDLPEEFPHAAACHMMRVNQPSGWFYNSDALRSICDIWGRHGSGIINMHGSTGDILLLGCKTEELEPAFSELIEAGFDLGGSGSDLRTPCCCCGMARCEWACYDTMALTHDLTMTYQDELHRPAFPHKFKFKMSGCPNDCVASVARTDFAIVGTWRDDIQIDQEAVRDYAAGGEVDIKRDVVELCPARCMDWDRRTLSIDNTSCTRCMHCINVMPKALAPGKDRGATIFLGSKAPHVGGALLSSVLVPFVKIEPPYREIKDLAERLWDIWCDNGRPRERVGEFIQRIGLANVLNQIGMRPGPEMIDHPRENPYIFFEDGREKE